MHRLLILLLSLCLPLSVHATGNDLMDAYENAQEITITDEQIESIADNFIDTDDETSDSDEENNTTDEVIADDTDNDTDKDITDIVADKDSTDEIQNTDEIEETQDSSNTIMGTEVDSVTILSYILIVLLFFLIIKLISIIYKFFRIFF